MIAVLLLAVLVALGFGVKMLASALATQRRTGSPTDALFQGAGGGALVIGSLAALVLVALQARGG
jgi:hypothetical protein